MDTAGSAPTHPCPITTSNPRGVLGQAAHPAPCQHCRLLEAHFGQHRVFLATFCCLNRPSMLKSSDACIAHGLADRQLPSKEGFFPPSCPNWLIRHQEGFCGTLWWRKLLFQQERARL